jgi:hypothetical protein
MGKAHERIWLEPGAEVLRDAHGLAGGGWICVRVARAAPSEGGMNSTTDGRGFSRMKRRQDSPDQMLMFAEVLPNGSGGFTIVPKKPVAEISSAQAARMLQVCRTSLSNIVNQPLGQKHLRWRWTSERKGKRVFELESVLAYKEALKALD